MAIVSTDGLQPNNYVDSCEKARRDFFMAATFVDEAVLGGEVTGSAGVYGFIDGLGEAVPVPASIGGYVDALGQEKALEVLKAWRANQQDLYDLVRATYRPSARLLAPRETDRVYMGSRMAMTDLRCRVFDALDLQEQHRAARKPISNT
jgi:hypothetical protein